MIMLQLAVTGMSYSLSIIYYVALKYLLLYLTYAFLHTRCANRITSIQRYG